MIVIHSSTPSSLLKAAMLSRLYNCRCLHRGLWAEAPPAVCSEDIVDSDSHPQVRQGYETRFGPVDWLDEKKGRELINSFHYASRYNAKDCYSLIIQVALQALSNGPDYVLSRVSREARNLFNRTRRVCMELHRACGFVRFTPSDGASGEPVLVGKASFENNIYDLVLRYFTRRHPDCRIFIINGETAYYLEDGKPKTSPIANLPFPVPEDDFSALWETYYDSQFIEGRKNIALAKKHLPKKYWSWVPEGHKLK